MKALEMLLEDNKENIKNSLMEMIFTQVRKELSEYYLLPPNAVSELMTELLEEMKAELKKELTATYGEEIKQAVMSGLKERVK